jgi:hypothetical protein
MVYGRYNELVHGGFVMVYKPTFTSLGGPILYGCKKKCGNPIPPIKTNSPATMMQGMESNIRAIPSLVGSLPLFPWLVVGPKKFNTQKGWFDSKHATIFVDTNPFDPNST